MVVATEWPIARGDRQTVKVRIHPGLWDALPQIFGEAVGARMDAGSSPDGNGWRVIELTFESPAAARTRILGLGPEAEVVEPNEIREAVRLAATATAALYAFKQFQEGNRPAAALGR